MVDIDEEQTKLTKATKEQTSKELRIPEHQPT